MYYINALQMCWFISHYSPSKLREFRIYVCVCVNNISVKSLFKNKIVGESLAQQCMFGDAEIYLA